MLLATAYGDDFAGLGAGAAAAAETSYWPVRAAAAETSYWPVRAYAACLLVPVVLGIEHFPLTHNGLFPFSGMQMRAARRLPRLIASARGADDADLVSVYLGQGAAQPAQCWHPVLAPAVAEAARTGDLVELERTAAAWLLAKTPLVAATGAAYDRVRVVTAPVRT